MMSTKMGFNYGRPFLALASIYLLSLAPLFQCSIFETAQNLLSWQHLKMKDSGESYAKDSVACEIKPKDLRTAAPFTYNHGKPQQTQLQRPSKYSVPSAKRYLLIRE